VLTGQRTSYNVFPVPEMPETRIFFRAVLLLTISLVDTGAPLGNRRWPYDNPGETIKNAIPNPKAMSLRAIESPGEHAKAVSLSATILILSLSRSRRSMRSLSAVRRKS